MTQNNNHGSTVHDTISLPRLKTNVFESPIVMGCEPVTAPPTYMGERFRRIVVASGGKHFLPLFQFKETVQHG